MRLKYQSLSGERYIPHIILMIIAVPCRVGYPVEFVVESLYLCQILNGKGGGCCCSRRGKKEWWVSEMMPLHYSMKFAHVKKICIFKLTNH